MTQFNVRNGMSERISSIALLIIFLLTTGQYVFAQGVQRDEKAISTLEAMSAYLAKLDSFTIIGNTLEDNRLEAGLIATYPNEITLAVIRLGSLHMRQFDGERTRELYLHQGDLSLYDSMEGYYATATVPNSLEGGMDYALNVLGIELPLMDLIFKDVFTRLAGSTDSVLYLTGKSRVDGVNCHQLAIRSEEADVQLWVQQDGPPLPRRIMITSKWQGGAPRFIARMNWNTSPEIAKGTFDFHPPEGATQIQFEPSN
jgi:hypothetical protein